MDLKFILDLFETKTFKFMAAFAVLGLVLSFSLLFGSIKNDRLEKRVMILKTLAEIDGKQIANPELQDIYEKTVSDFKNDSSYVKPTLATLSNAFKLTGKENLQNYFYKFLTGGILFLMLSIIQVLAGIMYVLKDPDLNKKDLLETVNFYHICIWLLPSVINMLIPSFDNPFINYLFFPSCLTLIFLSMGRIYQEAMGKFNKV